MSDVLLGLGLAMVGLFTVGAMARLAISLVRDREWLLLYIMVALFLILIGAFASTLGR